MTRTSSAAGVISVLAACALVAAGCGSSSTSDASSAPSSSAPATASSATDDTVSLVGRWQTTRTCEGMVDSLREAGLESMAPWVVGDYFPDQSPDELAEKDDVCAGASPQEHSHFFTDAGLFGSLDQDGNQVDDGGYALTDDHTLTMGDGALVWNYVIEGDVLRLTPVIPPAMKTQALADPTATDAGYLVAVAYTGHDWTRVDCDGWC